MRRLSTGCWAANAATAAAAAAALSADFFIAIAAAAVAARRCCASKAVRGGGIGGAGRGIVVGCCVLVVMANGGPGAATDALDLAPAGAIFAAYFLTSPGVGTGVEQVSATLPQLLPGAAVQSAAVVRRIRNGGTGHGDRTAAANCGIGSAAGGRISAETTDGCRCGGRCVAAASASVAAAAGSTTATSSAAAGAAEMMYGGVAIADAADAIGLAISEARPLGVQIFRTCPCRLIQKLNLPQMIPKRFTTFFFSVFGFEFSVWVADVYSTVGMAVIVNVFGVAL